MPPNGSPQTRRFASQCFCAWQDIDIFAIRPWMSCVEFRIGPVDTSVVHCVVPMCGMFLHRLRCRGKWHVILWAFPHWCPDRKKNKISSKWLGGRKLGGTSRQKPRFETRSHAELLQIPPPAHISLSLSLSLCLSVSIPLPLSFSLPLSLSSSTYFKSKCFIGFRTHYDSSVVWRSNAAVKNAVASDLDPFSHSKPVHS